MWLLIRSNLTRRKIRSALTVIAVAVGLALFLTLVGLTKGSLQDYIDRTRSLSADILIQPSKTNSVLSLSSMSMPEKYGKLLKKIKGVQKITPVYVWDTRIHGKPNLLYGIKKNSFRETTGGLKILKGRMFQTANEIVVDDRISRAMTWNPGDTVSLLNQTFTISGIFQSGKGVRLFADMDSIRRLVSHQDRVSIFLISVDAKQNVVDVANEIEKKSPLKAIVLDQFEKEIKKDLHAMTTFIDAITTTTLLVSFIVILLTMYTAILERTREVGLLKSLGANRSFILREILLESFVLCLLGVLLGWILSFFAKTAIESLYPTLTVTLFPKEMLKGAVFGIIGSMFGALYPAWIAAAKDPVESLRDE